MNTAEMLANQIERTREWTLKLLADFSGEEWAFQPAPGLQHALWLSGHLACAQDLLLFQRCLERSELDSGFASHFKIGGPIPAAEAHDWPAPQRVREMMDHMQAVTVKTVRQLSERTLDEPAYGKDGARHPHYDTKREAIAHLARHEAFHAGQLAMLRRLLGKSFLR